MSRHYIAVDWRAAGFASLIVFAVYWATLAPAITLEYSGQLVVAADHLGVARPPGYPVWHLLAKAFVTVFSGVEYGGHRNPAWAVNFMSAVFGAFACGAVALMVSRASREILGGAEVLSSRGLSFAAATPAITAALLFGFSPAMWSQSVIAETHALTNAFLLAFLAVLVSLTAQCDESRLCVIALMFGLSLSISYLLVLLAPVLLLAAASVSRRAALQFMAATSVFLLFIATEFAIARATPLNAFIVLGVTVGTALVLLPARQTRTAGCMLLLMLAGLLPYLYLPLAASHNPPMNMGYARIWEGFWHVLARGQYERLAPLNPFTHPVVFMEQLMWYLRLASSQFTAPILSIALVPALALPWLHRSVRPAVCMLLLAFFCFSVVTLLGANPKLDIQTTFIARALFIPSFAILALLIGLGLAIMLRGLAGPRGKEAPGGGLETG